MQGSQPRAQVLSRLAALSVFAHRPLRRQKFGGNEVGAAPEQRGKGGREDDAEAGHAEVSLMSGWAVRAAVFSRFRMEDQEAAPSGITAAPP